MAEVKPAIETFAKIKVIGIGGSGNSAVNRMIQAKIKGIEFIAANTDVQALHYCQAPNKVHLGKSLTRGLGAGMNPEIGKQAAEESQNELRDALKGADMVFVTCGLGGGTGSGAAPVVAEIARDLGALTVAVVTKPFGFEGSQRRKIAEQAHKDLVDNVDTIITIPNDRVLQIADKRTTLLEAFESVDDILKQGVQGISELITVPGMINVDFADVRAIMNDTGTALMGIGRGSGDNRAIEAAKAAISSPLLEISIDGAKGILFTISGSAKMGMHEVSEAAKVITSSAHENAKIIFGTVIDESLRDDVKICVIATGFDGERPAQAERNAAETSGYTANRFLKKDVGVPEVAAATKSEASKVKASTKSEQEAIVEEPEAKPFVKRVLSGFKEAATESRQPAPAVAAASADEDLEIPAFIRRKMN